MAHPASARNTLMALNRVRMAMQHSAVARRGLSSSAPLGGGDVLPKGGFGDQDPYNPRPWNYLWMPGPYPKTKEAREAAARKYGLLPEDYEPFPDDGDGKGDYPMLKPSSGDSRSGLEDWDIPSMKRNFGEVLDAQYDMYQETFYDNTSRQIISDGQAWAFFLGIVGFFTAIFCLDRNIIFQPVLEEELPYSEIGKVKKYYTFEKVE